MNKNNLDPTKTYRFIFGLNDKHHFWDRTRNYCRQTCFRDDWEMALKLITDEARIKKWFNKNKRFWDKPMVKLIVSFLEENDNNSYLARLFLSRQRIANLFGCEESIGRMYVYSDGIFLYSNGWFIQKQGNVQEQDVQNCEILQETVASCLSVSRDMLRNELSIEWDACNKQIMVENINGDRFAVISEKEFMSHDTKRMLVSTVDF